MKSFGLTSAALALCATLTFPVHAADYPTKPVTLVVPFPPGGATDLLARRITDKMAPMLGQPIVIENRAGAGGTVGSQYVSRAAPDGYTLLIGVTGSHSLSHSLYAKPLYHPVEDFAPISRLVTAPLVLTINPGLRAKTTQEYITYLKENPGKVSYGSSGVGTAMQLTGEMFNARTGTKAVHVPYKGSSATLNDLMGGQIQAMFVDPPVVIPYLRSDRIRLLGVTSLERHPLMPEIPTLAEAGLKDFEVLTWQGIFAPAGTPPDIVDKLNKAVVSVLNMPEIHDFFTAQGFVVSPTSPGEFHDFVKAETQKWAEVVKNANIEPR